MGKDEEMNREPNLKKDNKIEVIEERLVVGKEKISKGKVVLHKRVVEEDVPIDLNLIEEHIDVEVKKIGRQVEKPGPAVRKEGNTTIYSVYREVYVKQIILEEEVRLTKKQTEKPYHSSEKLRREVINVERFSGEREEQEVSREHEDRNNITPRRSQGDTHGFTNQGDI